MDRYYSGVHEKSIKILKMINKEITLSYLS